VYLNGSSSGFDTCYARTPGKAGCTPSVGFAGVNSNGHESACNPPYYANTAAWTDPYNLAANDYKTPASTTTCSANINSLTWSTASGGMQYARVCSTSNTKLTANLSLADSTNTNSRVLFLDGVGVDLNGFTLSSSSTVALSQNHVGVTIVATNTAAGATTIGTLSGSKYIVFDNSNNGTTAHLNLLAPGGTGASSLYSNFGFIADPSMTTESYFNNDAPSAKMNFDLIGVIYAPNSDITMSGSNNTTALGNYGQCFSMIGNWIDGSGGKITVGGGTGSTLTSGCSAAGIVTPTDIFGPPVLVA
jgi:hypothetical protein